MQHPKHILEQLNIRPRKKWGQNFLVSENNVKGIYQFASPDAQSNILEIGPGLGAMSELLIEKAQKYVGIEYDPILHQYLTNTYQQKHVTFHHQDILKFDLNKVFDGDTFCVIANLPYHITTPIVEKLIAIGTRVSSITVLLQKEVVARMCAQPNNKTYGRLSVWIQSMCFVEKGPTLKPGCFLPRPDVDSQVIKLTPQKAHIPEGFFDFVQSLFQKRRKTIGHILKSQDIDISKVNTIWLKSRPENLSIEELHALYVESH